MLLNCRIRTSKSETEDALGFQTALNRLASLTCLNDNHAGIIREDEQQGLVRGQLIGGMP